MADFPLSWPPAPSHRLNPPQDHYYASALWLCGRHPSLVRLVERVPGAVIVDEQDGRPWFELDALAVAVAALDEHRAAWDAYRHRTYEPRDEDRWQAWADAGPQHTNPGAKAIGPMSRTEVSRLRLLAFFASPPPRVQLSIGDLGGFDDEGRRLLHDWTLAVLCA